jgi:hypothetical protein
MPVHDNNNVEGSRGGQVFGLLVINPLPILVKSEEGKGAPRSGTKTGRETSRNKLAPHPRLWCCVCWARRLSRCPGSARRQKDKPTPVDGIPVEWYATDGGKVVMDKHLFRRFWGRPGLPSLRCISRPVRRSRS